MTTRKKPTRKTTPQDVAAAARVVIRAKRAQATTSRSALARKSDASFPADLSAIAVVSAADQKKVRDYLDRLSEDGVALKHARVVLRRLKRILMALDGVRQHPAIDC